MAFIKTLGLYLSLISFLVGAVMLAATVLIPCEDRWESIKEKIIFYGLMAPFVIICVLMYLGVY